MKIIIRLSYIYILVLIIGCGSNELTKERTYTADQLEISLAYLDTVKHHDWIKIDTLFFLHHKYAVAKYVDGAKPNEKDYFYPRSYIPLRTTKFIVYETKDRNWIEVASNNDMVNELAIKISQIRNDGKPVYKINSGPLLQFEGKLRISRVDDKPIELTLSKNHPFQVIPVDQKNNQ